MRKISSDLKQGINMILVIASIYIVLAYFEIGCPIKFLTGISCAGCGMTRAWLSVLKLNLKQAFYFHPLFWTVPIGIFIYLLRKRVSEKNVRFVIGIFIFLFTAVYIMRMMDPEDIVVNFEIYESIVWKTFKRVRELL